MINALKGLGIAVLLLAMLIVAIVASYGWLSLANLDQDTQSPHISQSVSVERDQYGVVTIKSANRGDAAFAMGYVHAQERFFQMDMLRRNAAGEMSELIGAATINADKQRRYHQLRARAEQILATLNTEHKHIIQQYTLGVNAGLAELSVKPWEYVVLDAEIMPWTDTDTLLAPFAMFLDLNDEDANFDHIRGAFDQSVPAELQAFLAPKYYQTDSPLMPFEPSTLTIPSADQIDLRKTSEVAHYFDHSEEYAIGSNNWAVSGTRTTHGGGTLANDMHLRIMAPGVWFRVQLQVEGQSQLTGVTLPGAPLVIVGSNEKVAWGFTNSYGDWSDLVELELSEDGSAYQTDNGMTEFVYEQEVIKVKDNEDVLLNIPHTRWGPVLNDDFRYAVRWTAHHPRALNLNLIDMEHATNVAQAQAVCNSAGIPPQNCVTADHEGNIGWTIGGAIPRRIDIDYRLPIHWSIADESWNGWLNADEYPRVVSPENGIIWTANAKTATGADLDKIGWGNYDPGARSGQIRDNLLALENADESDIFAVAYDDRGLFFERWHQRLLEITESSTAPLDQMLNAELQKWNGRASHDSKAFSIINKFRIAMINEMYQRIGEAINAQHGTTLEPERFPRVARGEDTTWLLLESEPAHFLPSEFISWADYQRYVLHRVVEPWVENDELSDRAVWHTVNNGSVDHMLAAALPSWLNDSLRGVIHMEDIPLNGSAHMPLVQSGKLGASERITVSPGREEYGLFNMPTGQSGNPFSEFYGLGHKEWATGVALPFLPTETIYAFEIQPE